MIQKLLIKGEEKVFTTPFVSGMVWRKYIECRTRMNMTDLQPKEVDELIEILVYAFNNQFTAEEFYEGVPHDQVMPTFNRLFSPTGEEEEGTEGNGKK